MLILLWLIVQSESQPIQFKDFSWGMSPDQVRLLAEEKEFSVLEDKVSKFSKKTQLKYEWRVGKWTLHVEFKFEKEQLKQVWISDHSAERKSQAVEERFNDLYADFEKKGWAPQRDNSGDYPIATAKNETGSVKLEMMAMPFEMLKATLVLDFKAGKPRSAGILD